MAVNAKLKAVYNKIWETPELFTANVISVIQERSRLRKNIDKSFRLTKEQKKAIRAYWKPYMRISTKWCQYYCRTYRFTKT